MKFQPKRTLWYFLQGLIYLTPIAVTTYVIWWAFTTLDGLLAPLSTAIFSFHIPGIGILVLFLGVSLIGFVITRFINVSVLKMIDGQLKRAPGIKVVYSAVSDLMSVLSNKSEGMGRPVRILVSRDPVQYKLGFITQTDLGAFDMGDDWVSVYMPYSYGIMGNQLIVNRADVELIDVPASKVMKFIVSGGVTRVEDQEEHHN